MGVFITDVDSMHNRTFDCANSIGRSATREGGMYKWIILLLHIVVVLFCEVVYPLCVGGAFGWRLAQITLLPVYTATTYFVFNALVFSRAGIALIV